jgi:hypothetical protein
MREAAQIVAETLEDTPDLRHISEDEDGADEEGPNVYTEEWRTADGQYQITCRLFNAVDDSHTCGIMHETTRAVEVTDLPCTWPLEPSKHNNAQEQAVNTVKLECGHVFHPVALAYHFLVTDMRCPVCRSGCTELMDIACVPGSVKPLFDAKIATSRQAQLQESMLTHPPQLPTIDVLSDIELEMRLLTGTGSTIRTRVVFNAQHVQEIQRVATHNSLPNEHNLLTTGLGVHRSFQRLIRCVVARQHSVNSGANIQFLLTHPLVPVVIASEAIPVSMAWSQLFNPVEMQEQRGSVNLYCPGVGGTQTVACIHSQYNDHMHAPEITIDVNMHMLISISSYVTEVLDSISESLQQNTIFDSSHVIDISSNAINGIIWDE